MSGEGSINGEWPALSPCVPLILGALTLCPRSRAAYAAVREGGTKTRRPYSVCWLTFNNTPTLASITNKLDPP